MKWLWTWSGKFFGYIENQRLRTFAGKHVANLEGDELYDENGNYIGEIRNENRLIVNDNKNAKTSKGFIPANDQTEKTEHQDRTELTEIRGHSDFPSIDSF